MDRSDEVLRQAADKIGVKALAAELKLSPALVYKWCQPFDAEDPDSSGTRNPLDRLGQIVELTGDVEIVNWLCRQAGGFFTPNPQVEQGHCRREVLMGTQGLVKEFSDMLEEVSRAIADDGAITAGEAARIRKHWEVLKRVAEGFVVCAEAGLFRDNPE